MRYNSKLLVIFGILFVISCQKDSLDEDLKNVATDESTFNSIDEEILTTEIKGKKYVLIQGDILIPYDEYNREEIDFRQRRNDVLPPTADVWSISYTIEQSVLDLPDGQDWVDALADAAAEWNEVADCRVSFWRTNNAFGRLRISAEDIGTPFAQVAFIGGTNGIIGSDVIINTTGPASDREGKITIMTNELGHIIGLHHTDQYSGSHMSCTPAKEFASIMHSTTSGTAEFTGLTDDDRLAVQKLYPWWYPAPTITNIQIFKREINYDYWANDIRFTIDNTLPRAESYVVQSLDDERIVGIGLTCGASFLIHGAVVDPEDVDQRFVAFATNSSRDVFGLQSNVMMGELYPEDGR